MPRDDLIQLRRGTAASWETENPILANGEPGWDVTNGVLKIGDGATAWNSLEGFSLLPTVFVNNVPGTSHTILESDLGTLHRYSDAGLVTVTLPAGLPIGSVVNLLSWGAGGLAIQGDGTSVVQPTGTVAQYDEVSCVVVDFDTWSVQGSVTP